MKNYDGKNQLNEGNKELAQASAKGKIKWFNATKGYGFVALDNGGDAFCHASALKGAGHRELPPGAVIVCDLAASQRGMQVATIHSVDLPSAAPHARGPRRNFNGDYADHRKAQSAPMNEGTIKFFDDQKGFGFIVPDNSAGDIFLHSAALRRSGVQTVEPDQRIRFSTCHGKRGVEVDRVELI